MVWSKTVHWYYILILCRHTYSNMKDHNRNDGHDASVCVCVCIYIYIYIYILFLSSHHRLSIYHLPIFYLPYYLCSTQKNSNKNSIILSKTIFFSKFDKVTENSHVTFSIISTSPHFSIFFSFLSSLSCFCDFLFYYRTTLLSWSHAISITRFSLLC